MTDSNDLNKYISSGNKKFKAKDFIGAIEDYTNAILLTPNNKNLFWKRGIAKSRLQDIKGSLNDFIKYEELNDLDHLNEKVDKQKRSISKNKVEIWLQQLNPREREVLRLRFGLDGLGTKTLKEIGKIFGLTGERIRQIEAKAVKKLRVIKALSSIIETKGLEDK